ncbi:MAG: MBL fold metallo-hydrolase [Deltaproteobacteria bacterium]|nr:MBL fold metallo-hydrolase [Deltaproteobacteria bacterium]
MYHEKGRGNGYLLTMGGKRVYFAGDTECTEEMKAMEGVDLAFVPMNLPYTMPPSEAAECVKAFRPAVVVPYHYAGSDLAEFSAALEGVEGVTVRIVEFYEGGLPF